MTGPARPSGSRPAREIAAADHATPAWLHAWSRCEPGRDVEAHAATVFAALSGRAWFARHGAGRRDLGQLSRGRAGLPPG
jgi:hypothetical protein